MKCANCGELITDCYASVIVDKDGNTEIWCGDCRDVCAWTCSMCWELYSYDLKHELDGNYEYICKECFEAYCKEDLFP